MAVAAAEQIKHYTPQESFGQQEKYAESMASLRRLAELACDTTISLQEHDQQKEVVFDDFKFAVAEMAATDPDYREILDVDPQKSFFVMDGQARAANGEPMVDVVARGEAESRTAAASNPAMGFQVVRDSGDTLNARRVDELPMGWTRLVPSMDPKEALQEYPDQAEELGYKEGMMYWQRYSRSNEDTLDTGSHSVDMSDTTIWRGLIKDFLGADIPAGISADEWSRHGIELECSAEEADELVRAMRTEYYKRCGATGKRYSVSEYVNQNVGVVKQIFDTYYPSFAQAINSGENNETMSNLATTMLQLGAAKKLKPAVRQQLVVIANSEKFDDEAGRTMNSILRYVTVEELRKGLPKFLNNPDASKSQTQIAIISQTVQQESSVLPIPPEALNERLALNLEVGVEAGRSYGGCAGQIELSFSDDPDGNNLQEAYGGRSCKELKDGEKTNCPHCHKKVKAIVPDRNTIYCSNEKCKMAAPDLKK